MTPYEITMLLEIYCGPQEPSAPDSPLKMQTLDSFRVNGLIRDTDDCARGYRATERAAVYIDHLCGQPWPVQQWVIPAVGKTAVESAKVDSEIL